MGSFLYNKVYTPLLFFQQFSLLDVFIDIHCLIRLEVFILNLGEGFYCFFVLALLHQNLGKYEEAIKALDGFSGDDQMVAPAIQGAIGNCYAQLGQLDKATSALLKAADHADNSTLSPIFLLQAGEILMKQGKNEEAVKAFTKIKDKYFQSYQAMDIDKYIEQAKLLKKSYPDWFG